MKREEARRLVDRIVVLKHACDLDLLVFFARHPRTMLTSEHLAAWLGYELKQIAESLEVLLEAGLLTRTQNPTQTARMFVFGAGATTGEWLPSLLELAATREGRLAMLEALGPAGSNGQIASSARDGARAGRGRRDEIPGTETG